MADPILHYLFEFQPDSSQRGRWERTVDYFIWTDLRPKDAPPLTLWEKLSEGVVRIPDKDTMLHDIRGGTPHHIEHLFGYWRACDADIIVIRNVQPNGIYNALILGGAPGEYKKDQILWICPKCANVLSRFEVMTGRSSWDRFWEEEQRRVADFNADVKLRTCSECGFEHPLAYRFAPQEDSPAERAAREAW